MQENITGNSIIEKISNRTSVRSYLREPIEKEKIQAVLRAGIRAPSGKNGQPWRFVILQEDKNLFEKAAALATAEFISKADCLIFVFLDKEQSYDYIKDSQAIGACIQNMLLAAEATGLGACWIGELNGKKAEIGELLGIGERYDLAAAITLGYPAAQRKLLSRRKPLSEVILKEF